MCLPGIEPGTFCVLDRCDNHYTISTDETIVIVYAAQGWKHFYIQYSIIQEFYIS